MALQPMIQDMLHGKDAAEMVALNVVTGTYFVSLGIGVNEAVAILVGASIVALNIVKALESRAKKKKAEAETRALDEGRIEPGDDE